MRIVDRTTWVWALLLAATVVSYLVGHGDQGSTHMTAAVVMVIAALKARFVIREFMEIRIAPGSWRWILDGWILAVVASVLILLFRAG